MQKFKPFFIVLVLISLSLSALAQEIGIDQWRDHLPYNKCLSVAEVSPEIYCATYQGLFSFNTSDNSISRLTKVNGLSDVGISWISYNKEQNTLLVAYANTNIDLIKNGTIINISDIKRKEILGNKTINKIQFVGKYAYLCCGFGIVVLDVEREEIKDTWYIGDNGSQVNVLDVTLNTTDSIIWAATENGLFYADYNNPYISSYTSWTRDTTIELPDQKYNAIVFFNGCIYANQSINDSASDMMYKKTEGKWDKVFTTNQARYNSVKVFLDKLVKCGDGFVDITNTNDSLIQRIYSYDGLGSIWPRPKDVHIDTDGNIWIADNRYGLIKNYDKWSYKQYLLNGPASTNVYAMNAKGNNVWVVSGGHTQSWAKTWNRAGIYAFTNNKWQSFNSDTDNTFDTITDFVCVAVNPTNPNKAYVGTWDKGLLELTDGALTEIYDSHNSTLQRENIENKYIMVGGVCFDNENNLWVICSHADIALSKRTPNGIWTSYDLGSALGGLDLGALLVDNYGQKWILTRSNNILVVNAANTQVKRLTSIIGNGNIPGNFIYSIAQDRDGAIWVGTDKGVIVFYSPENVFTGQNFDAQKILLEVGGYWQYLLETESVNAIAIDGANRKWFGTEKSGAFLMSSDGTKQVSHFTEEESPILANTISSIAIDADGEVFFGTSKGIVSYKGTAASPDNDTTKVYAYPNPVREGFNGSITIDGLADNSDVKITDIAGNLVYSTKANGSRAIWKGKNFDGSRAHSGVYLVFASDKNGSKTLVTKILVIK